MALNSYNEKQQQDAMKRARRLAGLLRQGYSLTEIARLEGVSRQAVTAVLDRFGLRDAVAK